jgi:hypothetical protein
VLADDHRLGRPPDHACGASGIRDVMKTTVVTFDGSPGTGAARSVPQNAEPPVIVVPAEPAGQRSDHARP